MNEREREKEREREREKHTYIHTYIYTHTHTHTGGGRLGEVVLDLAILLVEPRVSAEKLLGLSER